MKNKQPKCPFCEEPTGRLGKNRIISENEVSYTVLDKYPVSLDHTLIIPKRHGTTFFDLQQNELIGIYSELNKRRKNIQWIDKNVTGFNVGINVGIDAGQTVSHCHVHLIPRRKGDVLEPRGGVRNVIPEERHMTLLNTDFDNALDITKD